ncbi:MAG: T9SS type A sorting domain-containing protein [Bacteroidales bacterium]|nr:T9SS type A sorting domain-containing protein [Bacteroidales bacterium]
MNKLFSAVLFLGLLSLSGQEIKSYEYWYDENFSGRTHVEVTPTAMLYINENFSVAHLNPGIHFFNFRAQSTEGLWSSVISCMFYKIPPLFNLAQNIQAYQYWFDDQYNHNITENISPTSNFFLNLSLPLGSLANGLHTLHLRFKDNVGRWSPVLTSVFVKNSEFQEIHNSLLAYRYWFDDDQSMHFVPFSSPVYGSFIFINNLDLTTIEKGQHVLYIQFLDSLGQWSVPISSNFTKLSLPVARFTYHTDFSCDSTIVHFNNQSTDGDIYRWYLNGLLFSTSKNPIYTFTQPGTYHVSLYIQDTLNYLDSTISHNIEIKGKTYSEIYDIACDTYTSPSGSYTWQTSGTYYDTLTNNLGCDSIITIHLTIKNSTSATIAPVVCDSFVSPSGQFTWYASGYYTDVIPNIVGCDSVIYVNLTVVEIDTNVSINGQSLWANMPNAFYQWCKCDGGLLTPISNATNQSYEPVQSGFYAVIVSSQGCSDTSSCHFYDVTSLSDYFDRVFIYPNPAHDYLNIKLHVPQKIEIYGMEGNCVFKTDEEVSFMTINLKNLDKSIYFVKLSKMPQIFKLIKM